MTCLWKSLLIGAAAVLVAPAQAQLSPNPGAVNDCTMLTDPTAMRRCIENQQGVTTYSETPPRSDVSPLLKRERDYYRRSKVKKPKRKHRSRR
ncbi:hypothetical protein DNX69_21375 [Rhodopseudomonas palustris]|uniref:DUF4124 domain-containing protein n=2 Tax=Rhodopseudomonas palustris TaxID=1076 RepID=A0A323UD05_RHOPL|nr:hypothetical protein DNX69_21375 [Rhodopseudomonas palustris]